METNIRTILIRRMENDLDYLIANRLKILKEDPFIYDNEVKKLKWEDHKPFDYHMPIPPFEHAGIVHDTIALRCTFIKDTGGYYYGIMFEGKDPSGRIYGTHSLSSDIYYKD